MTPMQRLAYGVGQGARVAWFLGHKQIVERRVTRQADAATSSPPVAGALPDREAILRDLYALFRRDRTNVAEGRYRMPHDLLPDARDAWRTSRRFFADLGATDRRRIEGMHQEVFETHGAAGGYPRYYLQNFHFQTDGWLSEHSAELYDFQVEVLFNGGADAMRRQALLPLGDFLDGKRIADQPLLDLASGTARFLTFVKDNYPRLPVIASDLSVPYLAKARKNLGRWSWTDFVQAPAERLPFADDSLAVVSCIYLFHELPRKVRADVAREIARVLRPGGRLIFVDAFQTGDRPEFDGLLELFPRGHHEPYFADYAAHDLGRLFGAAGLVAAGRDLAFMSKILTFDKPGP